MIGSVLKQNLMNTPDLVVLLPQEYTELGLRMDELMARNMRAASNMGEAVEDGNVWHDNSAYDAALAEMEQIDNISKVLGPMIAAAQVVAPPTIVEVEATIGSNVLINNGRSQFHVFLVGQNKFDLNEAIIEAANLTDAEIVSLRSPLGLAVLGSVVGQVVQYELPGGQNMQLTVEDIDQTKRLPASETEPKL